MFYIATIWISGCGGSIRLTRLNALTEIEEDDLPVNNIRSSKVSKAKLLQLVGQLLLKSSALHVCFSRLL